MKRALLFFFTFLMAMAVVDDAYSQGSRADQRRREREIRKNLRRQNNYRGDQQILLPPSQRRIGVGVALNSFNYFGDLSPTANFYSTDISFTRPGAGAFVNYRALSNRIDLAAGVNWGILRGDDATSSDANDPLARYNNIRGLSFRNNIVELSAGARIYLYADGNGGTLQRRVLNPYIFVGGGGFYHNPQGRVPEFDYHSGWNGSTHVGIPITPETHGASPGDWVNLRPLATEGQGIVDGRNTYSPIQGMVMGGLGVRYRLADYLDLSFDLNIRYLFFDYIDDVSTTYVDLDTWGDTPEGRLARVMSDRSLERLSAYGGDLDEGYISSLYPGGFQVYTTDNGNTFAIIPGRGRSSDLNTRGNPSNDVYYVASFKLAYILGGSLKTSNQFR